MDTRGATIKAVEGFDKGGLKKADTMEKNNLPDKEGIYDRLLDQKIILDIYAFTKLWVRLSIFSQL